VRVGHCLGFSSGGTAIPHGRRDRTSKSAWVERPVVRFASVHRVKTAYIHRLANDAHRLAAQPANQSFVLGRRPDPKIKAGTSHAGAALQPASPARPETRCVRPILSRRASPAPEVGIRVSFGGRSAATVGLRCRKRLVLASSTTSLALRANRRGLASCQPDPSVVHRSRIGKRGASPALVRRDDGPFLSHATRSVADYPAGFGRQLPICLPRTREETP